MNSNFFVPIYPSAYGEQSMKATQMKIKQFREVRVSVSQMKWNEMKFINKFPQDQCVLVAINSPEQALHIAICCCWVDLAAEVVCIQ